MQKHAIKQMIDWNVYDERTQKFFIENLLDELEGLKN